MVKVEIILSFDQFKHLDYENQKATLKKNKIDTTNLIAFFHYLLIVLSSK